ncbi:capsular biosynthesis protein [Chitinibacter sp. SCUT-21]|uniref:capsule biosynthesis protein n=1 Tax=Chitinibacter sp. SCUT-21 TaxID=2970891 RepID=UPI0035A68434
MFGDRRPVHVPAVASAQRNGLRVHVFEEGYFRPYWVTLEREGVNARSLLPKDPDWYREVGASLPDYADGQAFRSAFSMRAIHDITYHVAGIWNPLFYSGYRTHAPVTAPIEYAAYLRRVASVFLCKQADQELIQRLATQKKTYYVLPLQLNSDTQIREYSQFSDMQQVLRFVMQSFALHAPSESLLVIKNHPLDTGLVNYARHINQLSGEFDLAGRVEYLESGDLNTLLLNAKGLVTVNSTVGGLAIHLGCPTITLSNPIYNLPGLTFQGGLDHFWSNIQPVDRDLSYFFRNTVIHATQVNGGFYCNEGITMAVENSMYALQSDVSPLTDLLQRFPISANSPRVNVTPNTVHSSTNELINIAAIEQS